MLAVLISVSIFVLSHSAIVNRHSSLVNSVDALSRKTSATPTPEGGFAGSASCVPCHRSEAEKQLTSNMARAAFHLREHPLFERFKNQAVRILGFRFAFLWEVEPFQISVVAEGEKEMRLPVQWAFGAGVHGVTFLSSLEKGKYLEYLLSYYSQTGRLDFTPGQGEKKFRDLVEALGQVQDRVEAFRCFSCHTTGTLDRADVENITVGELGVRCEACHGPGLRHLQAVGEQDWEGARKNVENPRRYSAGKILELCGRCHREPPVGPSRVNWRDPVQARFQPIGLSQSRCFQRSRGELSCLTCHDAHADAKRADPNFYSAICARCHSDLQFPPAKICTREQTSDCVSCHMPKVEAMRHMEFSNHWIGIYPTSNKLVPLRRN